MYADQQRPGPSWQEWSITVTLRIAAAVKALRNSVTPPILAGLGWTKSTVPASSRRPISSRVASFESQPDLGLAVYSDDLLCGTIYAIRFAETLSQVSSL